MFSNLCDRQHISSANKLFSKTKIEKEHHLKGTLQKQSNKHQNAPKTMLKAKKKNLPVATVHNTLRWCKHITSDRFY